MDFSTLLRSFACFDSLLLALRSSSLESFLLLQSFARCGFPPSVCSADRVDSFLSSRQFSHADPIAFVSGLACIGFPALVPGSAHAALTMSSRSLACIGPAYFVLRFSHAASSASLRAFCRIGPLPTFAGCGGSVLPVLTAAHLGFPVLLRSSSQVALTVLVMGFS